jgi:DNA ligase-1
MQAFTQLFNELDRTTRTSEKVEALERYFRTAEPRDAVWALYFLTGRKIKRAVNTRLLREWIIATTELPAWIVEESYDAVGDLAETLSLLLPNEGRATALPLHQIVEARIVPLLGMAPEAQQQLVNETWRLLDANQRLVWHKLVMGEFRFGVAATLVSRAIANVAGVTAAEMSHRLMGHWEPTLADYQSLMGNGNNLESIARPYPFFLAHPLEASLESLGDIGEWQAEWKWDGIRAQVIRRQGQVLVWSRGEELVTDRFPEIRDVGAALPDGTVLDGEILAWTGEHPMAFSVLQRRIGRKSVGAKLLSEAPVALMAYDVMEHDGQDIRNKPLSERRTILGELVRQVRLPALRISSTVPAATWEQLESIRSEARERGVEGLMLKRRNSAYGVGRPRGNWWKWKIAPLAVDAVLIYAQRGSGRRASLYTDYTFGVWNNGELVPIAKAYSGLTDEEIQEVDAFVRGHTVERFGPVRVVQPELVFELHFEGIQTSTRHKSGLAVRFPRMARWRKDKPASEADTLATMQSLAKHHASKEDGHDDQ